MNCDYQTFTTIVDKYTVTISFIIYHVTHVLQSCHIYCRSSTHEEEKTLVIGNTTDNLNKSTPTPPGGVPNQTTSHTLISNITTPTSHDNTGVKLNAARDTDHESNQEQIATIMIMLILVVVLMLILMLLTIVTVILVVCMTIRVMNMPQKQQI